MIYYSCHHCGLIFKSPEIYQDFDEQKKRYDLHENSEESEGYRAYFRRFLDFLLPRIGGTGQALDFGSGASSLLASMLEEEGFDCDRYDPVYYPDDSYKGCSYDLIVSVEVFEHLHHPDEVFGELLERVRPGGSLAIQTAFHPASEDRFLKWYYRQDPTHVLFFEPKTFRSLAERHACRYIEDNGKNMVLLGKA